MTDNDIDFNYTAWLSEYNRAHKCNLEPLPLKLLELDAIQRRRHLAEQINQQGSLAPQDSVVCSEGTFSRSRWQQKVVALIEDDTLWREKGRFYEQIAFKPQSLEQMMLWRSDWLTKKQAHLYTLNDCQQIIQSDAFRKLAAEYEQLLKTLANMPLLAEHPQYAKALRGAVLQRLKATQRQHKHFIETLLLRFERMQESDYQDSDVCASALITVQGFGITLPYQAPLKRMGMSLMQWESFYQYLKIHVQKPEHLTRLAAIDDRISVLGLVIAKRQDASSVWVPKALQKFVPKKLGFWQQLLPGIFRGKWARWKLFETQGLNLVRLVQGQARAKAYVFELEEFGELEQFMIQCEQTQALAIEGRSRLMAPPFSELRWPFHSKSLKALKLYQAQLDSHCQQVVKARVNAFESAISTLTRQFNQNELSQALWQQYKPMLFKLAQHCHSDSQYQSASLQQKLTGLFHQLMVLDCEFPFQSKRKTHSVELGPKRVVAKKALASESTAQCSTTRQSFDTKRTLMDTIDHLAKGEVGDALNLSILVQKLNAGVSCDLSEHTAKLNQIAKHCVDRLQQNPSELGKAHLKQHQSYLLAGFSVLKALKAHEQLTNVQMALQSYFLRYTELLLAHHVEGRATVYRAKQLGETVTVSSQNACIDGEIAKPCLIPASGTLSVYEHVICALSSDTRFHELTLAEWVTALKQSREQQEWGLHVTGLQDVKSAVQLAVLKRHWLCDIQLMNQQLMPWLKERHLTALQKVLLGAYERTVSQPHQGLSAKEKASYAKVKLQQQPQAVSSLLCFALEVNRGRDKLTQQSADASEIMAMHNREFQALRAHKELSVLRSLPAGQPKLFAARFGG